jgi:hypothetical protein
MFNAFMAFLDGDEKQYYKYLISHRMKTPRPVNDKDIAHVKRKMRGARKLFNDIKANGMYTPLEFYAKNGNVILFRGYRRLCILKKLGVKETAGRIHINEKTAKHFTDGFSWKPGSITELGCKQFAKYKHLCTDKHYVHNYLPIYDNLFQSLRRKKINILEIGVLNGASLRLWQQAFPKARIIGIDKTKHWQKMAGNLDRVKVITGNQEDEKTINIAKKYGPYHIIIDDANHRPGIQWEMFCHFWPMLASGGFYVIEDVYRTFIDHQSKLGHEKIKEISDWVESIYTNKEIKSIQYYYNMIVVMKGIAQ